MFFKPIGWFVRRIMHGLPRFGLYCITLFFVLNGFFLPITAVSASDDPFHEVIHLIKNNKYKSAYDILTANENKYRGTILEKRGNYLIGHTALRLKKSDICKSYFEKVVEDYSALADYAYYNISRCYAFTGKFRKVISHLEDFKDKYPFSRLIERVLFELGKYNILSGESEEGIKKLNVFIQRDPAENMAEAYFLTGQALEKLKKPVEAYEPYRNLYYKYPDSPFAEPALKRTIVIRRDRNLIIKITPILLRMTRVKILTQKGLYEDAIKDLNRILRLTDSKKERGEALLSLSLCYKRTRRKDKAVSELKKYIRLFPKGKDSAEALYNTGNIYWNMGKTGKALRYLLMTIKRFPKSKHAARANYVIARIYENQTKRTESLSIYKRLIADSRYDSLTQDAYWRTGWIYYNRGEYKEMIKKFKEAQKRFPYSSYRNSYRYWAGRAAEKSGDIEAAVSFYTKIDDFPHSYYSSLAKQRLEKTNTLPQTKRAAPSDNAQSLTPESLQVVSTANFQEALKGVMDGAQDRDRLHIRKALELIELGFMEDARLEIELASSAFKGNTTKREVLSRLYKKAAYYDKSISIQNNILWTLGSSKIKTLPSEFWNQLYPLNYWDIVSRYSKKNGIDPFLVLSVIRQESKFNLKALSIANARGLMQIIPVTGERVYQKLYNKKFDVESLFDPKINIELGTLYLSQLISLFNKNLVLAIASYNAGPGPVKRWSSRYKNMPSDEFIENISYPQTREYVKKVLSNYEIYKRLYSGIQQG